MSKRKRTFSCPECGNPYDAYPPDDRHTTASLEKPEEAEGSVIPITHDCLVCKTPITIYWYRPKLSFGFG